MSTEDTNNMMQYDASKKSAGLGFLLWVFGLHRFYFGRIVTGIIYVIVLVLGIATAAAPIILLAWSVWAIIDLCCINGWAKSHNLNLAAEIKRSSDWMEEQRQEKLKKEALKEEELRFEETLRHEEKNRASAAVSSNSSDSKTCPFCAETILAAAIKCKHCQSDLLTQ